MRHEHNFGRSKIFIRSPASLFALEGKRAVKTAWLCARIQVRVCVTVVCLCVCVCVLLLTCPFCHPTAGIVSRFCRAQKVQEAQGCADCHCRQLPRVCLRAVLCSVSCSFAHVTLYEWRGRWLARRRFKATQDACHVLSSFFRMWRERRLFLEHKHRLLMQKVGRCGFFVCFLPICLYN
jgi:hypothetical protein